MPGSWQPDQTGVRVWGTIVPGRVSRGEMVAVTLPPIARSGRVRLAAKARSA
jgi:hypothetical protein